MTEAIQVSLAFVGSLGFAVLFNVKGYKLVVCGIGGALSWIAYLAAASFCVNKVFSLFVATVVAAMLSELLARFFKVPAILFMVPMLIPLIPGSDLYNSTSYLFQNNLGEFGENSGLFLRKAGAMACGIIVMASLVQVLNYIKSCINNRKAMSRSDTPMKTSL